MNRWLPLRVLLASAAVAAAGCSVVTEPTPVTLPLQTLSDSGVTGSVTLVEIDADTTRVTVSVDPADHPDMPAHIHPGTCDELVPQPRFALASVVDGRSETEVPAPVEELLAGDVAINLHASNVRMDIYTACVNLR